MVLEFMLQESRQVEVTLAHFQRDSGKGLKQTSTMRDG